ncbi:MAG: hypothetical protein ACFFG0_19985 [Candidatus Thorarchaeota archaeon]
MVYKRKSFRCPQRLCSHKYQKVKQGLTADYLVCYNCGKVEKGELIPFNTEINAVNGLIMSSYQQERKRVKNTHY